MKDVREWAESDLVQIIKSGQKETTTLDYKASASLAFKDKTPLPDGKGTLGDNHRQDIIRDVASMANAEGGLIIYGIKEKKGGYPDHIDDGMDPQTGIGTLALAKMATTSVDYPAFAMVSTALACTGEDFRAPGPGCTCTAFAGSGSPHSEQTITGSNMCPQALCSCSIGRPRALTMWMFARDAELFKDHAGAGLL
jgi:hypothetical protein